MPGYGFNMHKQKHYSTSNLDEVVTRLRIVVNGNKRKQPTLQQSLHHVLFQCGHNQKLGTLDELATDFQHHLGQSIALVKRKVMTKRLSQRVATKHGNSVRV
jgi:hypothetical protein